MNLQDAASLTIPEGGVRNIRDGNGNLLWSSVGYNVRYDGDTYQQTYSGANLFDVADTSSVGTVTTVSEDGFITQSKDNSSGTGPVYNNYFTNNLALATSTAYAIVVEVQAVSGTGSLIPVSNHSSAQSTIQLEYPFSDLHAGDIIVGQFNTKSSFSGDNGIRSYTRYGAGESGSITYRISVLADTSVTPETFVYQPFTGNIPAPNPDYPQPIQVVTGTQTVTISDGVSTQSYEIDLTGENLLDVTTFENGYINSNGTVSGGGGTNAVFGFMPVLPETDYTVSVQKNSFAMSIAYYDSNKTLISRVTNDYVSRTSRTFTTPQNCAYARAGFYAGSGASQSIMEGALPQFEKGATATPYAPYYNYELCKLGTYQDYIYNSGSDWYVHKACNKATFNGTENWQKNDANVVFTLADAIDYMRDGTAPVSDNFLGQSGVTSFARMEDNKIGLLQSSTNNRTLIKYTAITSASALKTWLSTHNTIVYYPLATPTDAKITDATLIGQLNAVHNWLIRHDYFGTVLGNLPIIINRTGLT